MIFICLTVFVRFGDSGYKNRIVFLNVGQGDSILIESETGERVLIDGGPDDSVVYELSRVLKPWDRNIDRVILTHPHADHMSGLIDIIERFHVKEVWLNPVCYKSVIYKDLLSRGLNYITIDKDRSIVMGDVRIKVINPIIDNGLGNTSKQQCFESMDGNINNDSVVLEASVKDFKVLLMGDAEKELESQLLVDKRLNDVDVLKAGHHCSDTSSTDKFLNTVKPELVICSCGKGNSYGHPSPDTLVKFEERHVPYLVTWQSGTIDLDMDDRVYNIVK